MPMIYQQKVLYVNITFFHYYLHCKKRRVRSNAQFCYISETLKYLNRLQFAIEITLDKHTLCAALNSHFAASVVLPYVILWVSVLYLGPILLIF